MYTRLDVSTEVVKISGRADLVTDFDADDYSDNGIVRFIHKGQRLLENLAAWTKRDEHRVINITQGQFSKAVDNLRSLSYVKAFKSDGTTYPLDKVTFRELEDTFTMEYSQEAQGEPKYWCHLTSSLASNETRLLPLTSAPVETDLDLTGASGGTLLAAATKIWHVSKSASWSHSGGQLTYVPDGLSSTIAMGVNLNQIFNGAVELVIDCAPTVDSLAIMTAYWNGSAYTAIDSSQAIITGSGTYSFTPTQPWNCLFLFGASEGNTPSFSPPATINFRFSATAAGTIDSITVNTSLAGRELLILPPADSYYKLQIVGIFYEPRLISDSQTNRWTSEEFFDCLVLATLYELERSYNNETRAQEYKRQLEERLNELEKDQIEREWDDNLPLRIQG